MKINEYHLILRNDDIIKELIYRGNENIIIRTGGIFLIANPESQPCAQITIPRHILEKFMELIAQ